MTDVYAQMGIPMPEKTAEPDLTVDTAVEPDDFVEPKSDLCCTKCENMKSETEGVINTDWRDHEKRMREQELRVKAVELTFQYMHGTSSALMSTAGDVYKFLKDGPDVDESKPEDDVLGLDQF